ncbi:hypothetical protein O181_107960 [Austropuccinia psidii MF-1]|uniref:Uncharacterized protein n=1 Tax=Austropuccinia psidii MF-1 TaxID=1389203 RepID=A0A9Q3JRG2_9BASI|nr:hypothetical protein [Austropuccinia psidii MF-1]
MASSGHFDPSQTYDGYKAVEILDPACTECLAKGKDCFEHDNPRSSNVTIATLERSHAVKLEDKCQMQRHVARWTNVGGALPVGGRPIYSSSEVPISRINNEAVVKQITRSSDSPPNSDSEGSYELDDPRVISSTVPPEISSLLFHHSYFPSSCLNQSSHTRPALNQAVRPSPIPQPRNSPMATSQQHQPVDSTSRRREELSPLPFPAAQVFQRQDQWPIQITREYPNMESENQDAVDRLFRRVDRDCREVIRYSNDRTIPGTASEEMDAKFAWYEDELINDFQRAFDNLGRDN